MCWSLEELRYEDVKLDLLALQICGTIKGEKGIQRAEAMLYALDRINQDTTLLPGITLGCHILDTCLRDTYALEQSLEFIRPYMSSLNDEVQLCADGRPPVQYGTKQQLQPIAGVIGASASVVSVMVANMLQLFKVNTYTISRRTVARPTFEEGFCGGALVCL